MDWERVNSIYCGVLWTIALALALVILVHGFPHGAAPVHHPVAAAAR